jgi:hypothetical protein
MNNPFFDKSKEISNNFLQSIVFIDDKAYSQGNLAEPNHDFDAQKVSMAFAKEEKICGIYCPKSKLDIENFMSITKKADIIILDWQIILSDDGVEDPNADAPVEDPRGQYTIQILKNIVKDNESLKLIVVYTGETDLIDITNEIEVNLKTINPRFEKDLCEVYNDNIRVLIRAKSSVGDDEIDNKFNHLDDLNSKILKYKDLPIFVLDEFTKMTSGLLSNFALLSLTTIRNNSNKVLGLFSKELDSAFLSHKSILPNTDDAQDLLLDIMKDSIADLLLYNGTHKLIDKQFIEEWLEINIIDEDHSILNRKGKPLNPIETFERNKVKLVDLLFSEEKHVDKKFNSVFQELIENKEKREEFLKYLYFNNTALFLNKTNHEKVDQINKEFAKLTHHKSLFLPQSIEPRLTLGTILKSTKKQANYYMCIQQKCDSVRLKNGEDRKFLFLPLTITTDKFDLITPDGVKLKLDKKSFAIRTIKFVCSNDHGMIKGIQDANSKFIFSQIYSTENDENFEWIFDLKDLHSQRIVANLASAISRVGLDESEWLRRWAN